MVIVKPSTATTISTTATSGCEAWSLSYNVSRNAFSSQSETSSRPGYYLGWVYSYTGESQTYTVKEVGSYKFECWGCSGGLHKNIPCPGIYGGPAGYCAGNIKLSTSDKFYVYVGNDEQESTSYYTFNGGGGGEQPGGGATDIRLVGGTWSDFSSLKSRIMVAGGGGGAFYNMINITPGYAGGLSGYDAIGVVPNTGRSGYGGHGGTQISGGACGNYNQPYANVVGYNYNKNWDGSFGKGGYGIDNSKYLISSGGGGGYYGGGHGIHPTNNHSGGGGGSSFISGYPGCNAISASSTESNIIHTGQANHYSGYVFTNTVMKAGNESMPSPSGGTETGHSGNGCAIITQVSY